VPNQVIVTIRARLQPGRAAEFASLLDALRKIVERDGRTLADLPGVHFAQVFVLPGDPELDVSETLISLSEIDMPERAHLNTPRAVGLRGDCDGRLCCSSSRVGSIQRPTSSGVLGSTGLTFPSRLTAGPINWLCAY
jgi:hypothetical protein